MDYSLFEAQTIESSCCWRVVVERLDLKLSTHSPTVGFFRTELNGTLYSEAMMSLAVKNPNVVVRTHIIKFVIFWWCQLNLQYIIKFLIHCVWSPTALISFLYRQIIFESLLCQNNGQNWIFYMSCVDFAKDPRIWTLNLIESCKKSSPPGDLLIIYYELMKWFNINYYELIEWFSI